MRGASPFSNEGRGLKQYREILKDEPEAASPFSNEGLGLKHGVHSGTRYVGVRIALQ